MNCPMCNTPKDEHPASRCLDIWVAVEVMKLELPDDGHAWEKAEDGIGWIAESQDCSDNGEWLRSWTEIEWPPHYSTSIYCAWQVLEEMRKREWWPDLVSLGDNDMWGVFFFSKNYGGPDPHGIAIPAEHAICIAALKASASQQVECVT